MTALPTDQLLKFSERWWLIHVGYCKVYSYIFGLFLTLGVNVLGIVYSFWRNKSSTGTKVLGSESSWNVRSQGTKVPRERKFHLWTFRSRERKCRGTKSPTFIITSGRVLFYTASRCGCVGLGSVRPSLKIVWYTACKYRNVWRRCLCCPVTFRRLKGQSSKVKGQDKKSLSLDGKCWNRFQP